MTIIYLWLWFGVGFGLASDFHNEFRSDEGGHWFCVLLVLVFGPIVFPAIAARALSQRSSPDRDKVRINISHRTNPNEF